jgi:hypothetical protein
MIITMIHERSEVPEKNVAESNWGLGDKLVKRTKKHGTIWKSSIYKDILSTDGVTIEDTETIQSVVNSL